MVIDRGVHTKNFLSNSLNTNHRRDDEIDSDVSFSPSFLSIFDLCVLEDPIMIVTNFTTEQSQNGIFDGQIIGQLRCRGTYRERIDYPVSN